MEKQIINKKLDQSARRRSAGNHPKGSGITQKLNYRIFMSFHIAMSKEISNES